MKEKYMRMAIKEAEKAFTNGEVPVGAVIIKNDKIIAKAYNKKKKMNSVTRHAEIIAIEKASKKLHNWRLDDCDIYITLEPCPMCASAIKQSRISHIYCGLNNLDENNIKIVENILKKDKINGSCSIDCGYFSTEIEILMKKFFSLCRNKK